MTAEQTRKAALAASLEAQAIAKRENAKHTPGPWRTKREGFSTIYVEAPIGGGWVREIAACGPTNDGSAQQEANARLIAASPDLLEALSAVRKHTRHPDYDWPIDLAREVDAAIAKATGDTQ